MTHKAGRTGREGTKMSDGKDILEELFGGMSGFKVVTGRGMGQFQDLIDQLGKVCEADDCPIHGERNAAREAADEELSRFTSKDIYDMALGATAGAEQALRAGRYQVAEARQTQASLWMTLQERLDREETIEKRLSEARMEVANSWRSQTEADAQTIQNLRNQLSDADDDKAELRAEVERLKGNEGE